MRTAHIVTTPHEVGDRVLALCGKEHKVKTLWADIDLENFICRDCVDVAIRALDEADAVITLTRKRYRTAATFFGLINDGINPENGLDLDEIAAEAEEFAVMRAARKLAKEDEKKAKATCICTWTDQETFEVNPDCPIHGGQEPTVIFQPGPEDVPVAPPVPEGDGE